ncbi:hypothetical protein CVT24_002198 [Panaeolus cyanescens]|uniref:ThuA-like domain-containing protein n=1 Tax=Panaeolus cyanescens TaxID=181874 RepID=A0A409YHX8_9AGAR|nr:hypothetical protein CVT24_002198 [Panaeolus cyanescens]
MAAFKLAFVLYVLGCLLCLTPVIDGKPRLLIYSATAGFRHDSIPTAITVLKERADTISVEFDATEDRSQFSLDKLSSYDAIVFLSTTGEVLDGGGKAALQDYLNRGGGFVAIHSASDSLVNTTFYTRELGAVFDYHADLQHFSLNVLQPDHPSTAGVPAVWQVQDEAYNFKSDPRALGAVVLLSADDSTIIGKPEPGSWRTATYIDSQKIHEHHVLTKAHPIPLEKGAGVEPNGFAGRSFYTSLGHLNETWQDDIFMSHILGGISWVLQGNTTLAFNSSAMVGNAQTSQDPTSPAASDAPDNTGNPKTTGIVDHP